MSCVNRTQQQITCDLNAHKEDITFHEYAVRWRIKRVKIGKKNKFPRNQKKKKIFLNYPTRSASITIIFFFCFFPFLKVFYYPCQPDSTTYNLPQYNNFLFSRFVSSFFLLSKCQICKTFYIIYSGVVHIIVSNFCCHMGKNFMENKKNVNELKRISNIFE